MPEKAHAFPGEPVEVGSLDFFLTVATDLAPSEVISHDENDVGFLQVSRLGGWIGSCCRSGGEYEKGKGLE